TNTGCSQIKPVVSWLGSRGCVLAADGTGCDITSAWKVTNVPPTMTVDLRVTNPVPPGGSTTYPNLPSDPTQLSRVYAAGSYILTLFDYVTKEQLGETFALAVCPPGFAIDPDTGECLAPPTADLSANPSTIDSGESTTLSWTSVNATSCTSTGGFSTGGTPSGSASTGVLAETTTFGITCSHPIRGTSAPDYATVTVLQPEATITANPDRVSGGGTDSNVSVNWTATNINTCTITRNGQTWLVKTATSSRRLNWTSSDLVNSQTLYTVSCTNNASPTAVAATGSKVVNVTSGFQEF
ncbi:hypothetical protein HYV30_03945, partial [Candidatus Kaiserbacteria bacterium]|nr:hypothetical protein [Candidatus Kaiserbacteria bacterium]